MSDFERQIWTGCYDDSWKGVIAEDAFRHPAKFARGLVRRIYRECLDREWLRPADAVVDPFGGVALGALDAMSSGLHWVGCELEEHFWKLGMANIAAWEALGFSGSAHLMHGDSRRLSEHLAGVPDSLAAVIASPPYHGMEVPASVLQPGGRQGVRSSYRAAGSEACDHYGSSPGQLGYMPSGTLDAVISSPPYADEVKGRHGETETAAESRSKRRTEGGSLGQSQRNGGYGVSDGNLSGCKPGTVDAVVSSPPYTKDALGHGGGEGPRTTNAPHSKPGTPNSQVYGEMPGNLGNLKPGKVEGVISSPPFEASLSLDRPNAAERRRIARENGISNAEHVSPIDMERLGLRHEGDYGATPGNIGNDTGETFWSAARQIVQQCHAVLRDDGLAVWVCKDFVRKGERVPFSDDWRRLCEACGFATVLWVKASLVKEQRSPDLFGGEHVERKERKSFFRRLAEKKGSPAIDEEDVIFVRKV